MDIKKMPKGTLFRLFRETLITTSEHYYCHIHKIHKVKAHNVTLGKDETIGEVAMFGAHPVKPKETK
jgi:hypothetical protein